MSKHHHQSKAEQIDNKLHAAVQFQQDNLKYQNSGSVTSDDIPKKAVVDDGSIQLRAYQIYHEKGGSALDNWLEAEQILTKD